MIGCACRPSSLWGNLPSSSSSSSSPPTPTSSSRASIRSSSTSNFSNRTFIPVPIHPLSITTTTRSLLISCVSGHGRRRNQQQSVYETILHSSTLPLSGNDDHGGSGSSNNNNNNNNNNNGGWSWNSFDSEGWGWWWNGDGSSFSHHPLILFFLSSRASQDTIFGRNNKVLLLLLSALGLGYFYNFQVGSALARTAASAPPYDSSDNDKEEKGNEEEEGTLWEVRGGKWIKLIPDVFKDVFVVAPGTSSSSSSPLDNLWLQCRDIFIRLMLPEGFPESVTSDYLDYSLWRGVQGVASQISGVLATQSLLYAVGLGKGAIPTAAAINWVLKDGIGYLSKIFLSKYGRHFDVNPKGWRLFADLLENAAFGMEMLTPAFPQFFVLIGAAAGAGRSAAALIQAATRSCFYAGFAAQRNFAEVIAKGEAQGMVSKFIGIMLGIALANWIGSSTSLSLASFSVITWVHMYTNLKSYQCIQLRTLNPYRASLVFSEYLLSGQVPSVKEVNDEEPLFPAVPYFNLNPGYKVQSAGLSVEAKDAAAEIDRRLQLGSKLSNVVNSKQDALSLFDLYKNEGYILTEHEGQYCVILKESCSQQDMLKSVFHVNYLYWLESNAGIKWRNTIDECRPGGRLHISLDYVQREFNHVKYDGEVSGWTADGLIARPLPNRIRPGYVATTLAS